VKRFAATLLLCLLTARCSYLTAVLAPPPPEGREERPEVPAPVPAPPKTEMFFPDFSVVTAGTGDTYSSLAAEHLGDAALDWRLRRFNGAPAPQPGKALVVPHEPFDRGGFREGGHQAVPVISYHKFSRNQADTMTVTAEQFTAQMEHLKKGGFTPVTLDELFDFFDFQADLPERSVVITFDDGWRSVYEIAFPILRRYGFKATLFVSTGMVTGSSTTLSWAQIAEMAASCFDIQSHSVNHRDLTELQPGEALGDYLKDVEWELTESARVIEEKTGQPVRFLAYPYGSVNHLVATLLRKTGYRGALTVVRRSNPFYVSNYRVGRSMIYGDFDLENFKANLVTFVEEPAP